jgi:hypothetical protein
LPDDSLVFAAWDARLISARVEGGPVARTFYEVRVVGSLGPVARKAFADLMVDVEPTSTVLSGELEQADLHALLDRVRALGLELVEVKQAPGSK